MSIAGNELQQTINSLLIAFKDCNRIKNSDLRKLVDLSVALYACSNGEGGETGDIQHNATENIQGGSLFERFHLTQEQYNNLEFLTNKVDSLDDEGYTEGDEFISFYTTVKAVNDGLKVNIETGSSITTVPLGGIPAGTNIQNRTFESLLIQAMIVYQNPQFTSFSMSQASLIEVGDTLSGTKTFTWSTNNNGNINTNSLLIRDVTANTVLGSGLANDGIETLNIGTITNTSTITRNWRIEGLNTNSIGFNSNNYTVNSIYPIFYYVSNTPPIANQALIDSGIKQVVPSDGTLNITFGAVGQYLWFAHPASMPTKTKWYVNALNNGNIGTISDLFNAPTTVNITTVLWNGIPYKIYISNNPTTTSGNMELKNS